MKYPFLSKELSQLAKDKGFKEDCLFFYELIINGYHTIDSHLLSASGDTHLYIENEDEDYDVYFTLSNPSVFFNDKSHYILAPLQEQIIEWLYNKHDIFISIYPWDGDGVWKLYRNFKQEVIKEGIEMYVYDNGRFSGAYTVAIREALKLI